MNALTLTYIVPSDMDGTLLHDVLRRGVGLSSRQCRTAKHTPGAVLADGAAMYGNQRVHAGMLITVTLPPERPAHREMNVPLTVVYEDDVLLCVEKPAGIVCHPTRGLAKGEETLLERAGAYLGFVPHPVHRLDRGTSGLWLLAKSAYVQSRLTVLEKEYLAVCLGIPQARAGVIDRPILDVEGTARRVIDPGGKRAVTHYRVMRAARGISLLRLLPETGRTHQIRVHLSSIGCPILGDGLYGTEESLARTRDLGIERLELHACMLRFTHPLTGERTELRSTCQTFPTFMME